MPQYDLLDAHQNSAYGCLHYFFELGCVLAIKKFNPRISI